MANRIELEVDDDVYAALTEEAERTGVTVQELAGRYVMNDVGRRRFLAAADHFTQAWGPAFDERFGAVRAGGAAA
jgi:hypothetical protein